MANKIKDKSEYLYDWRPLFIEVLNRKGILLPKSATWLKIKECIEWYYKKELYKPVQPPILPVDGMNLPE